MSFYPPVGTGDFIGVSQTQVVEGNTPQDATHWQFQPAGTTDTLGPYSTIFSVQTYGTSPAVTETVWILGYNVPASYGGPDYDGSAGSVYMFIHPDAGDTNVGGAHGLEWGVGMFGPGGDWTANPILILAVNDSSESMEMTFTCGTGSDTGRVSGFTFQDSSLTPWLVMGPKTLLPQGGQGILSYYPMAIQPPSGTGLLASLDIVSPDQGASLVLQSYTGKNSYITWSANGTNKWIINGTGTNNYFSLSDVSSGNYPMYIEQVTSDVPLFRSQSTFRVETGSVIIGNAAIATTATRGFLYIPSCAGAPTGTPVSQTGTIPMVYDTTDSRLYLYESGGWHYISMTA